MQRLGCLRDPLSRTLCTIRSSTRVQPAIRYNLVRSVLKCSRIHSSEDAATAHHDENAAVLSASRLSTSFLDDSTRHGRSASSNHDSASRSEAEGSESPAESDMSHDGATAGVPVAVLQGGTGEGHWRHVGSAVKKAALARRMTKRVQSKLIKRKAQCARHIGRHRYLDGNLPAVFDETLRLLERASVMGNDMDSKRKEVVRLPQDVRVTFRGNASQTILEMMHRTGSHAQVVHFSEDQAVTSDLNNPPDSISGGGGQPLGFNALTLWGTPAENDAALKLLPEMVMPIHAGRSLSEELKIGDFEIDISNDKITDSEDPHSKTAVCRPELAQSAEGTSSGPSGKTRLVAATEPWGEEQEKSDVTAPIRQQQSTTNSSGPQEQSVVRPVWHTSTQDSILLWDFLLRRPAEGQSTLFERSRFDIDSATALSHYVSFLTSSIPRLLRRRIVGRLAAGENGQQSRTTIKQEVSAELVSVFNDRSVERFMTFEALTCALQFAVRISNYDLMRQLFSAVETNSFYEMDPSNFNVMLAAAAKREDVHNFRQTLRIMIRRNIRPTWRTWSCLHDLAWRLMNRDQALRTTKRLQKNGLLSTPEALRHASRSIIEKDLVFYLQRYPNFSLRKYLVRCDQLWGVAHTGPRLSSGHRFATVPRVWLSTSTANRMINVLLLRGMLSEAMEVLRSLEAAGESPDNVTLNTFLSFHLHSQNAAGAVAMIQDIGTFKNQATARATVNFDESTYTMLLSLAKSRRCFNMARVVWRYACSAGQVSARMEGQMLASLWSYVPALPSRRFRETRAVKEGEARLNSSMGSEAPGSHQNDGSPSPGLSRNQIFHGWMGKFAVGVSDGLPILRRGMSNASGMTSREHEILQLSAQPRNDNTFTADSPADFAQQDELEAKSTAPSIAHEKGKRRQDRLREMFETDLRETTSLRPKYPFAEMLQMAFEEDDRWHQSGMGTVVPSKNPDLAVQLADADDQEKTRLLAGMFEQMLQNGIEVPMVVGNAWLPQHAEHVDE